MAPKHFKLVFLQDLGTILQRDLSPDLDLNLGFGLKFCQKNVKSVVLDLRILQSS